jgi:hypothetical protein
MKRDRALAPMFTPFITHVTGVLCLAISLSGCESGGDNLLAQKIRVGVIEPTLIKHKICSDTNNCERRHVAMYFVSNGAAWQIYGTTNRPFINEVFANMLAFTKQLPRNKTFSISIYSVSEQDVGFFGKPIAQLIIQGEQ